MIINNESELDVAEKMRKWQARALKQGLREDDVTAGAPRGAVGAMIQFFFR